MRESFSSSSSSSVAGNTARAVDALGCGAKRAKIVKSCSLAYIVGGGALWYGADWRLLPFCSLFVVLRLQSSLRSLRYDAWLLRLWREKKELGERERARSARFMRE